MRRSFILRVFLVFIIFSMVEYSHAQKPFKMKFNEKIAVFTSEQIKTRYIPDLIANLNDICPLQIDGLNVLTSIKLDNGTLSCSSYIVNLSKSDVSNDIKKLFQDYGAEGFLASLLRKKVVNFSVMPEEEWERLFSELQIPFHLKICDEKGKLICESVSDTKSAIGNEEYKPKKKEYILYNGGMYPKVK